MKIMKIYIYTIYFPTSNKYYIGQTAYLERRMFAHLKSKSFVGNALRKYDEWQIEVLHTCKTKDEANRTEIEEIRHYNSVAPNGYNLTRGGDGGDTWSGKKNPKQSKRWKGKGNPFYGHQHTEESKEKISKSLKRRYSKTPRDKKVVEKKIIRQKKKVIKRKEIFTLTGREVLRIAAIKRNKENNPMKNSVIAKKQGNSQRGVQIGRKNGNYKNGNYTKEAKIKSCKKR